MKWSLSALSLWLSVAARAQNVSLPQNLDAETIESLGNNSLFLRWRPTSHVSAPAGWMNVCCSLLSPFLEKKLTCVGSLRHDV